MCTLFGVAYLINEHIVYVVVDLKVLEVLVRSFNCETVHVMLETLAKVFFRVRESNIFFEKVSRKSDIMIA